MSREEQERLEKLIINIIKLDDEDLKKVYWVIKGILLTKEN